MKLYELLLEDKKITEAPMGGLAKLGNKAMAKFGSARATGRLDVGAVANQLHNEFQSYLGRTGQESTKQAIIGFLSNKGYPTKGAVTIINQALKGQGPAPAGQLKTAAGNMASNVKQAVAKGASKVINKVTDKMKTEPSADAGAKVEPTLAKEPPVKDATPTGGFNNQLAGGKANYSVSTGFDSNTMKNTSEPMPTSKKSRSKKKVAVSASKINIGNPLSEAPAGVLPQSVVDKAFLKAAQENEIAKTGGAGTKNTGATTAEPAAASSNKPADSGADAGDTGSGFVAGLKKGFKGAPAPTPDLNDLAKRIAAIEKKVGLA